MAQKKKTTKKTQQWKKLLKKEIAGIFFAAAVLVVLLGLGPAGTFGQDLLRYLIGSMHPVFSIFLLLVAGYFMWKRSFPIPAADRASGAFLSTAGLVMLLHLPLRGRTTEDGFTAPLQQQWAEFGAPEGMSGGVAGALLFQSVQSLIAPAGAVLTASALIVAGIVLLSGRSFVEVLRYSSEKQKPFWKALKRKIQIRWEQFREEGKRKRENNETVETPEEPDHVPSVPPEPQETTDTSTSEEAPVIYDFTDNVQTNSKEEQAEPEREPVSVEEKDESRSIVVEEHENTDYRLPPMTLLQQPSQQSQSGERSMLSKNARKLEETLESFGVSAKVTKVHLGPSVTKYEVYPSTGVKVSRIVNLSDDLALALAAKDIRMEAPIPGKSAIGIEVPNQDVALVTLKEVLDSDEMKKSTNPLAIALGRDISGGAVMAELNKMPHLLVAGATGSGKSVCINGIIISILLRSKPHEVKLMMIDPKMVELNMYNGIPHLLSPVVTEPKKAAQALKKVVSEMERRYELFASTGTRNLEGYNQYIERENENREEAASPLPYIVVLVDELADLMMVASGEVEDAITRLAQMARAAGIHLIIATQRPSVDVITGVIKANIPSRIAFGVSSSTDSRTILDSVGAEKLLGKGDMLFQPVGAGKAGRIQGAFLSDGEVETVVRHCIEQQQAQYAEEMMPSEEPEKDESSSDDELYEDAVNMVAQMQTASVSMIQRRFRVGYARAARLIDEMEVRGVVGPYEGSKPREVLVAKPDEE
ncbi:FtsK/SpoIIIE family DNA translocase [Alkalicoccus chagannorensis]|uniref:FtsK/SpoIIIE family DNA translocase n=1 Tax=Alkalicoccus chagannorensis TaxID=427072 RepID=UPI00042A9220|nr:DNA translocase FtsK [Alkalicoccus chagannorensis]